MGLEAKMEYIIYLTSAISALATVIIAIYAYKTHCLTQEIKKSQSVRDQEVSDLFQGIVISMLLSGPSASNIEMILPKFKQYYKGKTKIF